MRLSGALSGVFAWHFPCSAKLTYRTPTPSPIIPVDLMDVHSTPPLWVQICSSFRAPVQSDPLNSAIKGVILVEVKVGVPGRQSIQRKVPLGIVVQHAQRLDDGLLEPREAVVAPGIVCLEMLQQNTPYEFCRYTCRTQWAPHCPRTDSGICPPRHRNPWRCRGRRCWPRSGGGRRHGLRSAGGGRGCRRCWMWCGTAVTVVAAEGRWRTAAAVRGQRWPPRTNRTTASQDCHRPRVAASQVGLRRFARATSAVFRGTSTGRCGGSVAIIHGGKDGIGWKE